jgi:hypothetical protein
MSYTKPEITSLASASFAIQGGKEFDLNFIDSQGMVNWKTIPAYQGDE